MSNFIKRKMWGAQTAPPPPGRPPGSLWCHSEQCICALSPHPNGWALSSPYATVSLLGWWEWRPHFQTSEPFALRETNISQALANLAQPESRKAELLASQSRLWQAGDKLGEMGRAIRCHYRKEEWGEKSHRVVTVPVTLLNSASIYIKCIIAGRATGARALVCLQTDRRPHSHPPFSGVSLSRFSRPSQASVFHLWKWRMISAFSPS